MKVADKLLIGIVVGIGLLVVVAFIVVLAQPEPEYRDSDLPEAVVHNYLLALSKGEYERAYEYLSPSLKGYPGSVEIFEDDVNGPYSFRLDSKDVTIDTQSSTIRSNLATVEVLETSFTGSGLFSSGNFNRRFDMKLRQENGVWRLVDGDRYWNYCWEQAPSDDSYCR